MRWPSPPPIVAAGTSRVSLGSSQIVRRTLGVVVTTIVVLGALFLGSGVLEPGAASAATAQTCGFAAAGTGTYAQTLCWFNLSGYNATAATSATGQPFTVSIPGGFTVAFTLKVTGGAIAPHVFPTYSGAYLGNAGHYTGVAGDPALYQTTSGTTTTATLTNIAVTDSTGTALSGFALVGADAESTDTGESLSWTSNTPFESLTATSAGNGLGNACAGGFTGIGTTTVSCTGGGGGGAKTGTAIVAATQPTTFAQSMHGAGLQAFAFGVLVSSVQISKHVVNGYPGDAFRIAVASPTGSVLASTNTNGTPTATSGAVTVLAGVTNEEYVLSESATSGLLSNYVGSWACTRNGAADPSLPSGNVGSSSPVSVGIGDFINCTITNTAQPASLSLTKHAGTPADVNGDGLVDAGDTIGYTFTVTNTGALPLASLGVTDTKVGAVTCPQPTLAVGATETCSAATVYTVTAADVATGAVTNTATATANPVGTTATVTSGPSSTATPLTAPAPSISLVKTANPTSVSGSGQSVTYSFLATNTGNVPLAQVTVAETGFSGTGPSPTIFCPVTVLAVGAAETCLASYDFTQADVDAGSVSNTAVASALPAGFTTQITSPVASAVVTAPAAPSITLVKSASPSDASDFTAGRTITYSYVLTNTGNVTLTSDTVTDTSFTGTGTAPVPTCPADAGVLAPGAQVVCSATYVLTQADVDGGILSNTAIATGIPPSGPAVSSDPSSVAIPFSSAPGVSLIKTATPSVVYLPGQSIHYSFTVTNTGNVSLHDPVITETSFTGSGPAPVTSCPTTTLLPGQDTICTADYSVTNADMAAGAIRNSATATAVDPTGNTTTSAPSSAVVTATLAAIDLQKTGTPTTVSAVGQKVTYSFLITNAGRVPLVGVGVTETSFSGSGSLVAADCPTVTLAIAAAETCTATYTVTSADLAAQTIINTAVAHGSVLGLSTPVLSDPSTATITVTTPVSPISPSQPPAQTTPAGTRLADTGSTTSGQAAYIGLLLLLVGVLAIRIPRRRHR